MPEKSQQKAKPAVLVKWRWKPPKKDRPIEARYWWSDGTRTEEKFTSFIDALLSLKAIQDSGGIRPQRAAS